MLHRVLWSLVILALCVQPVMGQPSVPTLTYQGRLVESGVPVTSAIDVQFTVHSDPIANSPVNTAQIVTSVTPDAGGNFTASVSLATAFATAGERYLEVQVSPAGQGTWTTLSPRQRLTHSPFAARSVTADTAGNAAQLTGQAATFYQSASNLTSGLLPSARLSGIYTGVISLINASNTIAGTHSGNGAGLSSLNASNLTTGTINDARLSNNVAMLNGANVFSVPNVFNSTVGIGTGTPEARLHVFAGSAGSVTADAFSVAVLENSTNSYLTLLSPAANARGIVFGEPGQEADGSILYNSTTAADGIDFRAAGNLSRMTIDGTGNVGIGTTTSEGKLHVFAGSAGAATAFPGSIAVFETNLGGYLSVLSPAANARGILFGEPGNAFAGAVVYNTAEVPDGMEFRAAGGQIAMTINSGQNIGIGTAGRSTDARLHVQADAARVIKVDRFTSDGDLLAWARDDTTIGSVSVAGGVVTYGAFTGVHYAELKGEVRVGELVSLTGENTTLGGRDPAETVYGVQTTAKANDPAVLGVFVGSLPAESFKHRADIAQIAAVGNGELWLVDTGADIAPGDYLISSATPGCAMKDDPERFEIGHVIARAASKVDWSTVKPAEDGGKRAKVSVLFGNFARTPPGLAERVRRVEELLGQR